MKTIIPKILKRKKEKGLPPGTLIYTGEHTEEEINIELIQYNEKQIIETKIQKEQISKKIANNKVNWINITGIHDSEIIEKIGKEFSINPLIQEDILNINQRPKIEQFEKHIYIVMKMPEYKKETHKLSMEQISLILGKNYVISLQEKQGDVFDTIRNRIKQGKGRIRKKKSDYLAYVLMDSIIDSYYSLLEELGEELEDTEIKLIENPTIEEQHKLNKDKKNLILLRKAVWPVRELISSLQRQDTKLISKELEPYLKDLYDHSVQAIDTVETYRDMTSSMTDLYMSSISNKMNEVMKVLTIFAAIFIPLTFIAGVYGMNFQYMPELNWKYGYLYVWILFLIIGGGMLIYFKRKNWL
ncbi:magnesium/cobalt transporter CorA [Candidatus Woesearchaeota archaeon]|nr:magnesium/cobalt transporter CorA [Candidatus Woesearchaeota archaeon]MCF7901697.1 magnesium/cobalt transporter CorA [Candidatus Woesearchaeota archaeon]MCF8013006.1 magnesium/cobalt transporter CorA [Candidatus Woesearchaeota archaeon]